MKQPLCETCYWSVWARDVDEVDYCNLFDMNLTDEICDCEDHWKEEEQEEAEQDCTRRMIVINNESYYILVGESFVLPTVPRENSPEMYTTRNIVDRVCNAVTATMRRRNREEGQGY